MKRLRRKERRSSPTAGPALISWYGKDLFDSCRGGLGQCALIVEARLRLVPAPPNVRTYHLPCGDLRSFLHEQRRLVDGGRFDYLLGSIRPGSMNKWDFSIEATRYLFSDREVDEASLLDGLPLTSGDVPPPQTSTFAAYANRLQAMEVGMKQAGTWAAYHPWMDLFLPASAAEEVIGAALSELDTRLLADGHLMTYPLSRGACSTPQLALPDDSHLFLFDVLPNIPRTEAPLLATFEALCRKIVQRAFAAGARVYPIGYPVGTPQMDQDAWKRHFQARWDALASAKRTYDPRGVLTPSLGLFPMRASSPSRKTPAAQ